MFEAKESCFPHPFVFIFSPILSVASTYTPLCSFTFLSVTFLLFFSHLLRLKFMHVISRSVSVCHCFHLPSFLSVFTLSFYLDVISFFPLCIFLTLLVFLIFTSLSWQCIFANSKNSLRHPYFWINLYIQKFEISPNISKSANLVFLSKITISLYLPKLAICSDLHKFGILKYLSKLKFSLYLPNFKSLFYVHLFPILLYLPKLSIFPYLSKLPNSSSFSIFQISPNRYQIS